MSGLRWSGTTSSVTLEQVEDGYRLGIEGRDDESADWTDGSWITLSAEELARLLNRIGAAAARYEVAAQ